MNHRYTEQLELVFDKDQSAIKQFREGAISGTQLGEIQANHANSLRTLIHREGFPFINETSEKAYRAAFLVIQHSEDIEWMEEIIFLLQNKNEREIIRTDLAFLIDRLRILKKQPQLYGTQYRVHDDKTFTFFDIEDETGLEARREKMGLESFKSYKEKIEKVLQ
jgi:hypothetical protein